MKQSQSSSFRASRYPTFSSLARLNLVLPACGRKWKKNNSEEGDTAFEPELLLGICSHHMVCKHIRVAFPQSSNCTQCPATLGTALEWCKVSPASIHHEHTQPGPGKPVLSWAPPVWVFQSLNTFLPQSWSYHQAPGVPPGSRSYHQATTSYHNRGGISTV